MTAAGHPRLVLASKSPRRARLLGMLGLPFEVRVAGIDETYRTGEEPAAHAERLAREKASAVAGDLPDAIVIGGDTIVFVDGVIFGKPRDADDAVRMLLRLQGREHAVATGIAVATPSREIRSAAERVRVFFRAFDSETAQRYVATGEPMDKAGAYGIQGFGAALVERIEGDFFAVMGLPVPRMLALLEEAGWRYTFRGLEPVK